MAHAEKLKDKRVCLLTGASGVLGTEFCRLFRRRYHIAAVCRNRLPDVPSQFSHAIDPLNPTETADDPVFVIKADLFDQREVQRVAELTLARFDRIDLLVNAAVHSRRWVPLVEYQEAVDSAARQFEMNTLVPLRLAVAIAHQFWRDRGDENIAGNR